MTVVPFGSEMISPRSGPKLTSTRPDGSTPTACAAATAASRLTSWCRAVNGTSSSTSRSRARIATRGGSKDSSTTSPAGPKRTVSTSRRYGSSAASPAGTIATPTCASSSPFARATPARSPTSSRWTGPISVITPTSGSAIRASSSICPNPRMPISSTSTSVPSGAASTASGRPISVLKFAGFATTRRCGASSAAISCFVDVLPTEPVTPITSASSSRRQAVASRCSAVSGSSATSTAPPDNSEACSGVTRTPQAPASKAAAAKRPPSTCSPRNPTNRSPADSPRVSISARAGPPGASATSSAPASEATRVASQEITPRPPATPGRSATSRPRPRDGLDRLARDLAVVERLDAPARELLPGLVPLAGDHHDVAGPRHGDRAEDRRAAVGVALDGRVRFGRDAGLDLVDDRLEWLGARVVGRDQGDVGDPCGDLAHQRPLAAIAVPAGAEHDDHPSGRELARRTQHLLQRIRLVRIVDDDRERLTRVDRLESARRDRRISEPRRLDRSAHRPHRRPRTQGVQDVEPPGDRHPRGKGAVRRQGREVAAGAVEAHVDRPVVGLAVDRERDDAVELLDQPPPVGVVGVRDPHARQLRGEQPPLGLEVVLHRGMEVQVVLVEVGEHRGGDPDRVRPPQLERVRGDLHRARDIAGVEHRAERPLQVDRLRRRARRLVLDAADDGLHGAQEPTGAAGSLQ